MVPRPGRPLGLSFLIVTASAGVSCGQPQDLSLGPHGLTRPLFMGSTMSFMASPHTRMWGRSAEVEEGPPSSRTRSKQTRSDGARVRYKYGGKNQKQVLKKCIKIITMVKLKLWARALTQKNIRFYLFIKCFGSVLVATYI